MPKLAYRWVRGAAGWLRDTAGGCSWDEGLPDAEPGEVSFDDDRIIYDDDGALPPLDSPGPLSDQAGVDRDAKEWADLWKAGEDYNVFFGDDIEPMTPLNSQELIDAAVAFPTDTGSRADSISPRALARLPREAIDELVDLLHQAEKLGSWSDAMSLVLIVMLPQDGGGMKPIGLFPTPIRVWMRARATVARKWEADTARPDL